MAMNDLDLDHLIRQSAPKPEFEGSFPREVWARIAIASESQKRGPGAWFEAALERLSRPVPAFATAVVMLLLGAGLGLGVPDSRNRGASRDAYLASINPLAPRIETRGE
jgi:hypothetical protein